MKKLLTREATTRSRNIREIYHELEVKHHGTEWTVEEDALAFLTDAGLVGRLTMAQQGRWPIEGAHDIEYKLGECIWWLIVLAERTGMDADHALTAFLAATEKQLQSSVRKKQQRSRAKQRDKRTSS